MYFYSKDDCIKCNDCMNDPCDASCNTACNPKVNCYESYKVFAPDIYAKPYITLQPYEHLFNLNAALLNSSTICGYVKAPNSPPFPALLVSSEYFLANLAKSSPFLAF